MIDQSSVGHSPVSQVATSKSRDLCSKMHQEGVLHPLTSGSEIPPPGEEGYSSTVSTPSSGHSNRKHPKESPAENERRGHHHAQKRQTDTTPIQPQHQFLRHLFHRISVEHEIHRPTNSVQFIVDLLCTNYPDHIPGIAALRNLDPELEEERKDVVFFFKQNKLSSQIASHFINSGYDTVDTLSHLTTDSLEDIERFNNVQWLPGHKVRLLQLFGDINQKIKEHKCLLQQNSQQGQSPFPTSTPTGGLTSINVPLSQSLGFARSASPTAMLPTSPFANSSCIMGPAGAPRAAFQFRYPQNLLTQNQAGTLQPIGQAQSLNPQGLQQNPHQLNVSKVCPPHMLSPQQPQ